MDIYVKLFGRVTTGAEYQKHTILIETGGVSEFGNTLSPPPYHFCIHGAHIPDCVYYKVAQSLFLLVEVQTHGLLHMINS